MIEPFPAGPQHPDVTLIRNFALDPPDAVALVVSAAQDPDILPFDAVGAAAVILRSGARPGCQLVDGPPVDGARGRHGARGPSQVPKANGTTVCL